MHTTATRPTPNLTSRTASTFDAYSRYKALTLGQRTNHSQPKPSSVKPTFPAESTSITQTELAYDSSDRNSQIVQINPSTAAGTAIQYTRDVQGRLTKRRSFTISNWNWTETVAAQSNYGYTASGDTPDFVKDNSGTIVEKYLTLPGDVLLTIRPTETDTAKQKTYSLPNIHGDIMATTNTSGIVQGTYTSGPFGESLNITGTNQTQPVIASLANQPASKDPNNTRPGTSFDYVGQHEKLTESSLTLQPTQMGARVYIASLGRFLSVDPVQGGTPNNFVYPTDPINEFDLNGQFIPLLLGAAYVASVAWQAYDTYRNPSPFNMVLLGISVAPGVGLVAKGMKAGGKVAQVTLNAAKGARGEKFVAGVLRMKPLLKVQTSRSATGVKTSLGMRYSDIITRNRITGTVIRYEIKTGRAIYNNAQRKKDALIKAAGQKTRCIRLSRSLRC